MKSKILVVWALLVLWLIAALTGSKSSASEIPKTWDEAALAEWATPVAGSNVRPTHISAKEYYALPVENLRTYPVNLPGREPEGYWEKLQKIGPQPLIEPEKLKTEANWVLGWPSPRALSLIASARRCIVSASGYFPW
jgi:hypothetical protein